MPKVRLQVVINSIVIESYGYKIFDNNSTWLMPGRLKKHYFSSAERFGTVLRIPDLLKTGALCPVQNEGSLSKPVGAPFVINIRVEPGLRSAGLVSLSHLAEPMAGCFACLNF